MTTITGRIVNTGTISNKVGEAFVLVRTTVSGGIFNTGAISAGGGGAAFAEGVVTIDGGVSGVAATYMASSAKFKDGSSTNVSSYQGAAYAGWAGGPWYALGSVVASFNDFSAPRGFSRPSGFRATPPRHPRARAIRAMRKADTIGCFRQRA